jgi:hypothetical protein
MRFEPMNWEQAREHTQLALFAEETQLDLFDSGSDFHGELGFSIGNAHDFS